MSEKELLIENLEELEDDLYCVGLLRGYLDSDDTEESISLEDYAKQNGIVI